MPLTALPVSPGDLTTLQTGIQFFTNSVQASSQSAAINKTGATQSVFTYAASLLDSNISLSQVAMAVGAIAESGTLAVGAAGTPNTLAHFTTQFLPAQIAFAAANHFNQTVYAAEALGEALATSTSSAPAFQTDWGSLSSSAFVTAVATATGIHASAIATWLTNWTSILGNTTEARGATLGDAIGTALLNPTLANLETVFSTQGSNGFTPNTVTGLVANALIDNAEGTYKTGVALGALPAHTPLQGEFVSSGPVITLTTGVDTVILNQSNSTVNGTFGGAGATWTPGDTITAAAGTTGEVFNITGNGTLGVIDPTSLAGNKVSGVETVNINANTAFGAVATEAVHGNFTATGTEGDWVGLTTLNIFSGGNLANADNVTVDPTTAVNITDTSTLGTSVGAALTVTGGSVITITETNLDLISANLGGIVVNGGTGTTSVTITQTEVGASLDGIVTITDGGFATMAAGTITTVKLDGLSVTSPGFTDTGINAINDNALTTLTVNNSDNEAFFGAAPPGVVDTGQLGAQLHITDNLATPTATTLTLSLSNDGIGPFGNQALTIWDVNNEYSTVDLTVVSNSFANFVDNGLVTLKTTTGTGALVGEFTLASSESAFTVHTEGTASTIYDSVAAVVTFDFSGLNGPNDIAVDRGATLNADAYTLGNFGTDNGYFSNPLGFPTDIPMGNSQNFSIFNTNPLNVATISFGSGAYNIWAAEGATPPFHGAYGYVETAQNGAGLISGLSAATPLAHWAAIFESLPGDTLTFAKDPVQSVLEVGPVPTVQIGIAQALLDTTGPHQALFFTVGPHTFVFDHADSVTTGVTAADAMVEFVGIAYTAGVGHSQVNASHVITLAA